MSIFLSEIKRDSQAKVIGFSPNCSYKIKRRLLELGFFNGTMITLSQRSFLNEVLLVELNGYLISLRADIAKNIIVENV